MYSSYTEIKYLPLFAGDGEGSALKLGKRRRRFAKALRRRRIPSLILTLTGLMLGLVFGRIGVSNPPVSTVYDSFVDM